MSEKIRTYHIYQLIDPRDGKPFYVGCTVKALKARLKNHLQDKNSTAYPRLKELADLGLTPEIEELDRIVGCKKLGNSLENEWIKLLYLRHGLVNKRYGVDSEFHLRLMHFDTNRAFLHKLANKTTEQIQVMIQEYNRLLPANYGMDLDDNWHRWNKYIIKAAAWVKVVK